MSCYKDDPEFFQALFDQQIAIRLIYKYKIPIPELEPIISTNSHFAFDYAKEILRKPFPEGEPAIFKNPINSSYYLPNLLKKRIPCAEMNICTNPYAILQYTVNVYAKLVEKLNPCNAPTHLMPDCYSSLTLLPSPLAVYGLKNRILDNLSLLDRFEILRFYFDYMLPRLKEFILGQATNGKVYKSIKLYPDPKLIPDSNAIQHILNEFLVKAGEEPKKIPSRFNADEGDI